MSKKSMQDLINQFLEIQKGTPWLDESFSKKLVNVDDRNAFNRPGPDIHSIGEIMSHLIVWRFEIISRLKGNLRRMSAESPENWKSNQELKAEGWNTLITGFNQSQDDLIDLLHSVDDDFLNMPYHDRDYRYLVEGLLHHDVYHLGQIGLVIKMLKLN